MIKKEYNENDQIEFKLEHNVGDHYWLLWRFKEPRKFLFFKIRDKWKMLSYYCPGFFAPEDNPDRDFSWYWRGFRLGKNSEVSEYEWIKNNIKTEKQIRNYYHMDENLALYEKHKKMHQEWLNNLSDNIKKHVK